MDTVPTSEKDDDQFALTAVGASSSTVLLSRSQRRQQALSAMAADMLLSSYENDIDHSAMARRTVTTALQNQRGATGDRRPVRGTADQQVKSRVRAFSVTALRRRYVLTTVFTVDNRRYGAADPRDEASGARHRHADLRKHSSTLKSITPSDRGGLRQQ